MTLIGALTQTEIILYIVKQNGYLTQFGLPQLHALYSIVSPFNTACYNYYRSSMHAYTLQRQQLVREGIDIPNCSSNCKQLGEHNCP